MITPPPIPAPFPYDDLPAGLLDEIDRFNKAAFILTIGMAVALFVPVVFLFEIGFGIVKIVQSSMLTRQFPGIKHPMEKFPGKMKTEIKQLSFVHANLKRVLDFSQARKAFWVATLFPILLIGALIGFLLSLPS